MRIPAGIFAALVACGPALADDAQLRAGGLELVPNDAISIVSEDLYISADEIRVVYRFYNDTATAQNLLMAFPLPSLNASYRAVNLNLPNAASSNFVDFEATADGVPVEAELVEKATILGVDRTADVLSLGLPLNPLAALDIPPDRREAAAGLGLFGGGMPAWEYQPTFYWHQNFPPNAETVIEQRYTPVLGGGPWNTAPLGSERFRETYCIADSFASTIDTESRRRRPFNVHTIGYTLAAPNKWQGPIGTFRLVVDKTDPSSFASFCGLNVQKISETEFEMTAARLYATGQLDIVIFYPAPF